MPRLGKNLFEHLEIARGLVGNHFDRCHDGDGKSTVKEPPGYAAVPLRRDVNVDGLAMLIHGPVDIPPATGDLDVSLIELPAGRDPVLGTAGS